MTTQPDQGSRDELAVGLTVFAGLLMVVIGVFQVIAGVTALVSGEFFISGREHLLPLDTTTWGWIHLLLGVVVGLAGVFLYSGAIWARTLGVVVAVASAVANFAALPSYPMWSTIVIALDVFIIWALTVHGRDITR